MFGLGRGAGGGAVDDTGGGASIDVHDKQTISLLGRILKQMKIMNIHNSLMTGEEIKNEDVES